MLAEATKMNLTLQEATPILENRFQIKSDYSKTKMH